MSTASESPNKDNEMPEDKTPADESRREFLRKTGAAAIGLMGVVGAVSSLDAKQEGNGYGNNAYGGSSNSKKRS